MKRGLIIGTGPSLSDQAHLVPRFDGLVFGPNNTYQDFNLDCWLACDPAWHDHYGQIETSADCWHWDRGICADYGYRHVEGVWMVDGKAYPRTEYITPPGDAGGLWMEDKSRLSLNHCSGAQLLNLCLNQYECDEAILIGHDFHYNGPKRHYFSGLSDQDGEYPAPLRKHSPFEKNNGLDDLMSVYQRIADQPGIPRIVNCTPGSALRWFECDDFENYLK